jgi:quinol monooxygenase YgiN
MDKHLIAPQSGVTHVGTIKIDPANVQKFLEAFRVCWLAVCKEQDCIYFDVFHSQTEPGMFHFVEVWSKDNEWFMEVQITKDYYKPYWDITRPLWMDRDLHVYNRLSGWNFVDDRYLEGSVKTKEEL